MRKMNDTKKNTKGSTQGSLGSTIRRIRELRGWTQADLGERIGFSPSTRVVRVGQYENNKQFPRGKTLDNLAKALEVDTSALLDIDLSNPLQMYHALFEMEQYHSIHPECIDGKYVLCFSEDKVVGNQTPSSDNEKFLEDWYNAHELYLPEENDSPSTTEKKKKAYELWQYEYPNNKNDYLKSNSYLEEENRILREKVDFMYADSHRDDELKKLNAAIQPFRDKHIPALPHGDLFTFNLNEAILEVMETGVAATQEAYSRTTDSRTLLVALKTDDILKNAEAIEKYYKFRHIIDSMKKNYKPTEDIISRNEELFIAFWMNTDSQKKKEIANDICYLDDMQRLVSLKDTLSDAEYSRKRQDLIDTFYISNISI